MTDTTQEQSGDRLENVQPDLHSEQPDTLRQYYYQMLLLRRFEERTSEMYTKARIGGYCHLNLGEEATIVGLMAALTPEDYIFTNYREHGYIIARGVAPGPVMAELFGKETGVSGGRGGSMHLFDARRTSWAATRSSAGRCRWRPARPMPSNTRSDRAWLSARSAMRPPTSAPGTNRSISRSSISSRSIFFIVNNGYRHGHHR